MTRPVFHLTPRAGWVNDPYGLTWHDGRYHLFFQHVPGSTVWRADQSWGHAVSADLRTWEQRPDVLSPAAGEGLWSGSVADGRVFLTSVDAAQPSIGSVRTAAPADDAWESWTAGPVVVTAPDQLDLAEFRDPFVLRDGDRWRMVVGGGTSDGTPLVLSWTSSDLGTWTPDGVLCTGDGPGSAWECPQLFPVGGRWVLLVSVWDAGVTHHEAYAVGDLVDGRFHAGPWHRLTYGTPYAGSASVDRDGRPVLVHWLRDVAGDGWAGAHSVPQVVSLEGDRLRVGPHPAVADLVEPLHPGEARRIGGVELTLTDDVLSTGSWTMPNDGHPVGVLVDGPVVEVFGSLGVGGLTV